MYIRVLPSLGVVGTAVSQSVAGAPVCTLRVTMFGRTNLYVQAG